MPTQLPLNPLAEKAIQVYLDWLTAWALENDQMQGPTRADCDDFGAGPKLLNDWHSQHTVNRTMTILVDPYHDEGGPTILTAFFSNYTSDPHAWTLDAVIQLFDTMHQFIFNEGKLTNIPGSD
jgi:hypothetical protein